MNWWNRWYLRGGQRPFLWLFFVLLGCCILLATGDGAVQAQDPTATPIPPYVDIGVWYEQAGQTEKALEFYIKALEANPADRRPLENVRRLLTAPPVDPRLAVADQYARIGDYEKAVALYLEILKETPNSVRAQQGAQTAVTAANNVWRQTLREARDVLTTGIAWLLVLLVLLLFVRVVRLIWSWGLRQDVQAPVWALLPFHNATGAEALVGSEQAVRATVADWLFQAGAAVKEHDVLVRQVELPDLGFSSVKLVNWLVTQIRPLTPVTLVEGTLLGVRQEQGRREIGLALHTRRYGSDQAEQMRIFWYPISQTDPTVADYVLLANQAASWLSGLATGETEMMPDAARLLHEAHEQSARGLLFLTRDKSNEARTAFGRAAQLAGRAQTREEELSVSTWKAVPMGPGGSTLESRFPSTLAAERQALFQRYAESVP